MTDTERISDIMNLEIKMSDYLLTGVRSVGLLSNNGTVLTVDGNICTIVKHIAFCTGKQFEADSGLIDISIPFELSSKDVTTIENIAVGIETSNQCKFKDFNNAVVSEQYKKHDFTSVKINGVEYTVPKSSKYLADLSKIYMPEVKRYINLNSLKIV